MLASRSAGTRSELARFHDLPLSRDTSTRVIRRLPPLYAYPRSYICILETLGLNSFAMPRCCDGAVDVEVVKNIFWLSPPPFLSRLFGGTQFGRKNFVVLQVEDVRRVVFAGFDTSEPFDAATPDASRNKNSDGETMIGWEELRHSFYMRASHHNVRT
jgi:hypothetical protein